MEKLMHYVWQHRLWLQSDMSTIDGRRVQVIDPGLHNHDSGPDFFNAKISIDGRIWCGNVEIHVKASDWMRHGHHNNEAYDSVILHVVSVNDMTITRHDGSVIPQLILPCAPDFDRRYDSLVNNQESELSCASEIGSLPALYITDWLSSLAYERLYAKCERIAALYKNLSGNWAEVVYVTLARSLGFGINSDAMERLALATPLHCLMKHRDSPETIEGALFGQAGFLDNPPDNSFYIKRMQQEYAFMMSKFDLKPLKSPGWKMARMRPNNFPHRRIATLAAMVYRGFTISSRIFSVESVDEAYSLFEFELLGYWSRRYNFNSDNAPSARALSHDAATILIINLVVPMLYTYGTIRGEDDICNRAIDILHQLKAESNSIVRMFVKAGISCPDAFTSQALIELRRKYCEPRKCLYCRIGHRLLSAKVKP